MAFLVTLAIVAWADAAPRTDERAAPIPLSLEAFHQGYLDRVRRGNVMSAEWIEFQERLLAELPQLFSREEAKRHREQISKARQTLEYWQAVEKALADWELQRKESPGQDTDGRAREQLKRLREQFEAAKHRAVAPGEPIPKGVHFVQGGYSGKVSAVGPDWVEIGPGWEGVRRNGKPLWDENDSKKPKRISVAGTWVGGAPAELTDRECHWLTDVKLGDIVQVMTAVSDEGKEWGKEWGKEIRIHRRPGGKIPLSHPYPGDALAVLRPRESEQYQAEQDWEEKGIPIPRYYLNKDGRYPHTNPPYPPVAPMPREKK